MPRSTPATSCAGCFAWGLHGAGPCLACRAFNRSHAVAACAGCHREVAVKKAYCRLCWAQAGLEAKGQVTVLEPFLRDIRHHQLFLAGLQRTRGGPKPGRGGRRTLRPRPPGPTPGPIPGWTQLRLFDAARDFSRFDRRLHADPTNPWLGQARTTAQTIGQARGWSPAVAGCVDRALVILLSSHSAGDTVRYSEMFPVLRRHQLSIERTVEVLDRIGVFDDDRVPAFESWLQRKLAALAPGIRADVESWLRALHDGGPRTRALSPGTVWGYLNGVLPVLVDWSDRYDHLREVTREDIVAAAGELHGSKRHHTVTVLRSLFRYCKKNGTIFRDPAARVRVGQTPYGLILPLRTTEIADTLTAATTPSVRLTIALAAVHAARPKEIRSILLDDIDLGNRRLIVAGRIRPLDDLTRHLALDWLRYRRARWPCTANPHLIINQQTAMETGPISGVSITQALRGQAATLERLRVDRQLDEALTRGPDPLHLAAVFGLDDKTAIRYANAARHLLESPAEQYAATSSPRTQGSTPAPRRDGPLGST